MLTLPSHQTLALRKPLIILILFCFLLQTGGLLLLMYSKQMALKREMKARLKADSNQPGQTFLELELKNGEPIAASFEWEEEGDEFRYNGSIYDVIEKKIIGNKLYVRCVDDKHEAAVMKVAEELHKREHRGDQPYSAPLYQLLSLLLFDQHNCSQPVAITYLIQHIDQYHASFSPIVIDILSPPPRTANLIYC